MTVKKLDNDHNVVKLKVDSKQSDVTAVENTDQNINIPVQAQLVDLQIRLAYLDDTVEQLNTIVIKQNLELEQLTKQFELLAKKVQGLDEDNTVDPFIPSQNRPPHY